MDDNINDSFNVDKYISDILDKSNNIKFGGSNTELKTVSLLDKKLSNQKKENFINNEFQQICGIPYEPAIFPDAPRIVVLGDIHGDYKLAVKLLIIAGIIPKSGELRWIGKNTVVVQVGDQIDRCRPVGNMMCNNPKLLGNTDEASDLKILNLFTELDRQSRMAGGRVISLLGNHELLNVSGYMQYVSYLGLKQFENYKTKEGNIIVDGEEGRKYAFKAGNDWGKYLGCNRHIACIVGNHLFVHAGIVDGLIAELGIEKTQDLETINMGVRMWLLGLLKKKYLKTVLKSSKISMFWTRILGKIPPNVPLSNPACSSHISGVLQLFKVNDIVIGHTPQSFEFSDNINSTCDGKVWRVDNGSSAAFHTFDREYMQTQKTTYARRPQVLEILNDMKGNVKYNVLDEN